MLFAEAPVNALVLVPLIFWGTATFLIGDVVGPLPFFLRGGRTGRAWRPWRCCPVAWPG